MDNERFDALARGLATGRVSRRQSLKMLLGGVASTAVLGRASFLTPSPALAQTARICGQCSGRPYDPTAQCCTPSGVQLKRPILNLETCPNRVPRQGYKATFNGCGSADFDVPDAVPGVFDFTSACNIHDICYDTCNNDKLECDQLFHELMLLHCRSTHSPLDPTLRYCLQAADLYYAGVVVGAGSAYRDAQMNACDCCGDETCSSGQCECQQGTTCCDGNCSDLQTDVNNCGACGNTCPPDEQCEGGQCTGCKPACTAGQTCCNETCIDTETNPSHCGGCGNVCASGESCINGRCTGCNPACLGGQTCCGNTCVNTRIDRNNCGICGKVCPAGENCTNGQCGGGTCPSGQTYCENALACRDLNSDRNYCGNCYHICEFTAFRSQCIGGECTCLPDPDGPSFPCTYRATGLEGDGREYTYTSCCDSTRHCCHPGGEVRRGVKLLGCVSVSVYDRPKPPAGQACPPP